MPVPHLPSELTGQILQNVWHNALAAWERIQFMKACPLVTRKWRALYDIVASRDVYIPSMQYLHYLLHIITTGRSHIHTPTSRFSARTRSIVVQTVDLDDDWLSSSTSFHSDQREDQFAQMLTYRRLLSELRHSSFSGVHLCFPAATHIIFESITLNRLSDDVKYALLSVRLDGHATVNAQWGVMLGYGDIELEENWTRWSRIQLAYPVIIALRRHMDFELAGFPPDPADVLDSLTLEDNNILAVPISWEPKPLPTFGLENLDLYFKRAAVGYYSIYILLEFLRHWWANVMYRRRLLLSQVHIIPSSSFRIKQDVQPFYDLRILNMMLAVSVNLYMIFHWPLFSIAYASLIFCFCSKHSFLVSVFIVTLLTSFIMTRFLFLMGFVSSVLTFLEPLLGPGSLMLVGLVFPRLANYLLLMRLALLVFGTLKVFRSWIDEILRVTAGITEFVRAMF